MPTIQPHSRRPVFCSAWRIGVYHEGNPALHHRAVRHRQRGHVHHLRHRQIGRKKGDWRIAEATLHLMSLVGGWPGALLAQQTLRHKSSKVEFQWAYKATVIVNLAVTTWLLTPRGPELTLALLDKVFK